MDEEDVKKRAATNDNDANATWSRQQIRKELKRIRVRSEQNEEMVSEIYEFIFNDEGVEGRSVVDDLMLLRTLYNNVSGFSAIIGFVIGVFTIVVPVAVGLFKLYEYIIRWITN